jgi:hypothetical protein
MGKRGRFGSLLGAAIASAALIGVAGFAVLAQTPGMSGPITFNLFTGDSVDLNQKEAQRLINAARKAKAPGECPLGRLTIRAAKGDPLFQEALAAARRDAVLQYLNSQGIAVSRFIAEAVVGGMEGQDDVRLDLNAGRDDIPPTLDVTWTPPKGSKVKAKQRITAKAVARDDANRWQTGINTIDLNVDGGGSFGFHDYPRPQPPCANPPPPRILDGVYTVPADPPPLVRLRAVAKDFAGNETEVWAEFPTGDWYGHIDWWIPSPYSRNWGRLDVTFDYDGQGNLKGRMAGDQHVESPPRGEFCGMTTQTPVKLSANVVGQYTPGRNTMSLRFADPHLEQGQFSMCAIGPSGGPLFMSGQPFGGGGPLGQPALDRLLNSLTVRTDGSVEASGEGPVAPAHSPQTTLHLKLTLRRTQN